MKKKRIAIIGAGFTGLAAAYDLTKEGFQVEVLEKNKKIGGLVAGFEINGYPLEKAYHFVYKTDKVMHSMLEELGISDQLEFHNSSIATYYDDVMYPMMTPVDLLKFKPLSLINRLRAGLVVLMLQFKKSYDDLVRVTAYDWMIKWAGKDVVRVIWEPLLRGKFDKYYNKVSMTFLWSRIQVRALSKERGDSVEKLGYFKGGWIKLIDQFEKHIVENGGIIKTGVNIAAIDRDPASGEVILDVDGKKEKFDAVLVTTPSHVFVKLAGEKNLPEDYVEKLNSMDYLGAVMMPFSSSQEFTPYYWHNINDMDLPFVVLINLTALVGKEQFGGKNIYYIGDYMPHDHRYFEMEDKDIMKEWIDALKKIFPDFDESKIDEKYIFKFKNAQHIVDVNFPEINVPFETPLEGVYLSNFTQVYPDDRGTNFAIRDGRKVAQEIIEYLQA